MDVEHVEETLNPEQANRRLPNAFILFCKKHRSIVKEKYPNLENRNITKILGEWWSSLEPEEKNVFNNLAADLKEHHATKDHHHHHPHQMQRKPANHQREHIIENSSNLSAAVVLAAASPLAPCWQKQRGQAALTWQPSPMVQQQQVPLTVVAPTIAVVSRNSSGSSSPEPSPKPSALGANSGIVEAAPKKTFKQRYLADEKAKLVSLPGLTAEPETNACEALLQLAGGGVHHALTQPAQSGDTTRSNSGTCSPKDQNDSSGSGSKLRGAGFQSLRDAVWSRVAQTILTQEKEKGNDCEGSDQPINLSNQCTIRGQTIIEHIIENILDEPMPTGQVLNNNRTGNADCPETAEQIKDIIYQSLKDDIMNRAANNIPDGYKGRNALWSMLPNPKGSGPSTLPNGTEAPLLPTVPLGEAKSDSLTLPVTKSESVQITPSVSVTLVPVYNNKGEAATPQNPLNLSTTPPQTPISSSGVAITITATSPVKRAILEDDDDDIRRSSRSCKGKRYQEFKDAVGRKGRRSHRSGDSSDLMSEDEATMTPLNLLATSQRTNPIPESNGIQQHYGRLQEPEKGKFDVDKQLNAIPALDLDLFQQKIINNRLAAKSGTAATVPQPQKRPNETANSVAAAKKKMRRVENLKQGIGEMMDPNN